MRSLCSNYYSSFCVYDVSGFAAMLCPLFYQCHLASRSAESCFIPLIPGGMVALRTKLRVKNNIRVSFHQLSDFNDQPQVCFSNVPYAFSVICHVAALCHGCFSHATGVLKLCPTDFHLNLQG